MNSVETLEIEIVANSTETRSAILFSDGSVSVCVGEDVETEVDVILTSEHGDPRADFITREEEGKGTRLGFLLEEDFPSNFIAQWGAIQREE